MTTQTERVDVLERILNCGEAMRDVHDIVEEMVAALKDGEDALHACIDALGSEEQSDYDARDRMRKVLARIGGDNV